MKNTPNAHTLNSEKLLDVARKIWSFLPPHRKRGAINLWMLLVLGMFLELLGVGLVVPVIAILVQPDLLSHSQIMRPLAENLVSMDRRYLTVMVMAGLFLVYLLKNIYLAFLAWKQTGFVFGLQAELSTRLFRAYISQPYIFHVQRNSAILIRNIQGEIGMLINNSFNPIVQLCAESLVILGFCLLLIYVEPVVTIILFVVVGFFSIAYLNKTKSYIVGWGEARLHHDGIRGRQLQQGLAAVKDIKLLGREAECLDLYEKHTHESTHMNQKQAALQQIPRLFFELIAVLALSGLVIMLTFKGGNMTTIIPTLALFSAVAFRLLPSMNRVISSYNQFRFGLASVNLLFKELSLSSNEVHQDKSKPPLIFNHSIQLENLEFSYPKGGKLTLSGINLTIKKGELVGFIGASGSGKSTLIDMVLGLFEPNQGCIRVDGESIQNNLRSWQNQIGYVPQSIYLIDDTIRRNIALGLLESEIDEDAVNRALKAAQLEEFVSTLAEGVNSMVGERGVKLSGGQRQRIGIARALYHNPSVLVLDEATSALDVDTESGVMQAIEALHGTKTILIVAHRLTTVAGCDRLYRMHKGQLEVVESAIL